MSGNEASSELVSKSEMIDIARSLVDEGPESFAVVEGVGVEGSPC